MLGYKVLLFTLLVIVSEGFAARLVYSASYLEPNGKTRGNRHLAELDDDKEDAVLQNMGTWSENKYKANKNARLNLITITPVTVPVANRDASTEAIKDMRHIVATNTKDEAAESSDKQVTDE